MAQNKRIAPFFNADGTVKEFTVQDNNVHNTGDYAVQNKNLATVGARYSIQNIDGKNIVVVDTDQDIFEGLKTVEEQRSVARQYILEKFRNKDFSTGDNKTVTVVRKGAKKFTNTRQESKLRVSTELNNLIQTGEYSHSALNEKTVNPEYEHYEYYDIEFILGNKKFEGLLNIGVEKNGMGRFYDITNIKEKGASVNSFGNTPAPASSYTPFLEDTSDLPTYGLKEPKTSANSPSSISSIRYKTEKVNSFEEKSFEKDSQTVGKVNENAYSSSLKGRESEFLYAPVSAETMPTETAKKVMNTLTKLTNGNVNVVLTSETMTTADGQTASGVFANGILYLNANATAYDQAMIVGSHELIHTLEGTKEYHALGDFITETITGDPELQKKYDVNRYVAAYANVQSENYSTETKQYEALTEMYADFIANEILTNENTVQRLVNRNRNVVVRMVDWVRSAVKRLGMTKDDRAAYDAMRKWEKLLSSALNAGKGGISLDEVEERVQANKQAETQEKTAERSSTGKLSDARYSIDEKFADRIDKWDEKTVGFSFVVGKTSEALKSIGVAEHQIRWDATKVRKVLSDHSMMSKEVIKQVPQVIENPIVIMDSKQIKDRLVVLGDVYDKHGDIVTVILELNPTRRNIKGDSAYLDIIKIASAQGRSNTQGLINGSNIRYIDKNKNRVNEWLKVNRLQLPLLSTTIDSTNSISEKNEEVNSFDKNSSKNSDERYSIDINSPKTDFNGVLRQYLHRIDLTKDIKQALAEKYGKETARRIVNIWDNTSGQIGVDMSTVTKEIADKGVYIDAYYPEDVLFELDKEMRGYTDLALTDYDFDNQIRRVTETQEKRPIKQRIQDVKAGTKEEWVDLQIQTTNV